jgi:zeaxanthin glucosyltransferase
MKLGLICPQAPGHLNPITALARQLQARNHDVVFLYSSGAAGLPFVPGPDKDDIHEAVAELSKLLSTLLNEALNNSTYRDNARQLQKAIVKANGLSVAADLVETSLGVTKKAGAFQV